MEEGRRRDRIRVASMVVDVRAQGLGDDVVTESQWICIGMLKGVLIRQRGCVELFGYTGIRENKCGKMNAERA